MDMKNGQAVGGHTAQRMKAGLVTEGVGLELRRSRHSGKSSFPCSYSW